MKSFIYLDCAASTPLDKRVLAKMLPFLSEQQGYGNSNASHFYGREAKQAIEQARGQVAQLIHAKPAEIVWTSGATEANNLAIKGLAYANQAKGKHIITTQIEHSSVLDSCAQLEKEGFTVTYLPVEKEGTVNLITLQQALRSDTILVSIMHVNNETGVVQNIKAIGDLVHAQGSYFHVDAVQSVSKELIDLADWPVDLMSFSAHKVYGPKGIGALYVNHAREIKWQPLFNGGGQEQGLRPGTLATHQIVGMGEAFALAQQMMLEDNKRINDLSARFWRGVNQVGSVYLNGNLASKVPHILNIAFADIETKALLPALKDLAVSTGSACHEGRAAASHVLSALGVSEQLINSSIRFSFGRFTTVAEIDLAVEKVNTAVRVLRDMRYG